MENMFMFHCFLHGSCKGQCSSKVISCTCSNSSFESVLIVLAGLTGPLTVENPGQSQMVWVDLVKPNAAAANREPLEQHVGVVERAGRQAHIWIFLSLFSGPFWIFLFRTEKNETKWNSGSTFDGRTKQPARLVQQAIWKVMIWNLPIWSSLLTRMFHGGIQASPSGSIKQIGHANLKTQELLE